MGESIKVSSWQLVSIVIGVLSVLVAPLMQGLVNKDVSFPKLPQAPQSSRNIFVGHREGHPAVSSLYATFPHR